MTTRFRRLKRRVSRRGYILLFFGLIAVSFGFSLLAPTEIASSQLVFAHRILPLWGWASLWLASAVLSFYYAFDRHDRIAYATFTGLCGLWGLVSLGGWAARLVERGWLGGLIWIGFASVALVISSWPDPQRDREAAP